MTISTRILIIGSGPAGYTAAIYAARAGLDPVLVTGMQPGGQLMNTPDVDNWPGEEQTVSGQMLMQRMRQHTLRFVQQVINDHIISVDVSKRPFLVKGEIFSYAADTIVVATGATARYLGLPGEASLTGRGISACATCDGFFFSGQNVAVVGGGNTAVEEALYLSGIAEKVTLIHRRDSLRAEKIMQKRLMEAVHNGKIEMCWNTEVNSYLTLNDTFSGLKLFNRVTNNYSELSVEGVFMAIGHTPNTQFLSGLAEMKDGYLWVGGHHTEYATMTSIPGIFAAGDIADSRYRQAITSAGTGCMAALDAERWLI